MAKAPQKPKIPPLVDSREAREIFVSEVVGAAIIGGCVNVNLAVHRWSVPEPGAKPVMSRVVVARLVLSSEAAGQMMNQLTGLSAQLGKLREAKSSGNGK